MSGGPQARFSGRTVELHAAQGITAFTYEGPKGSFASKTWEPEESLGTTVNLFHGGSACSALPLFGALAYHGLYPGIDVRFASLGGSLKSEYRIDPGGRPDQIRIRFNGKQPRIGRGGELQAATAAGEIVLVCGHHPLLPAAGDQMWNPQPVLELLLKYPCAKAWLNGHNHAGDYAVYEGLHCITFRSILHQPETNAWAEVIVHDDRLIIEGHGREVSRDLPFRS